MQYSSPEEFYEKLSGLQSNYSNPFTKPEELSEVHHDWW